MSSCNFNFFFFMSFSLGWKEIKLTQNKLLKLKIIIKYLKLNDNLSENIYVKQMKLPKFMKKANK